MNEDVKNAIDGAKSVLSAYYNDSLIYDCEFEGYQQAYFTTNEKIGSYLNIHDISKAKTALAVTSGGDHAFNLITEGILDIDTFDVNELTEYLAFGLRRALIIKYSYNEYINIIKNLLDKNTSNLEISNIISDLLPLMDEKYRIFWSNIIDYNYRLQQQKNIDKNMILALFVGIKKIETIMFNNNYLLNEDFYNKLKKYIGKANLTFTCANANELHKVFNDKDYDLILLSNILDYFYNTYGADWEYPILKSYLEKLKTITKEDAIIYINYIFIYEWSNFFNKNVRPNLIRNSNIKLDDLENETLHKFSTEHDMINDAMLLLKIKK